MNHVVEPNAPTVDLFHVLDEAGRKVHGFAFSRYREGEVTLLRPALEMCGYTLEGEFFSGESDSWGPLSRCIYATKDGERVCLVYG